MHRMKVGLVAAGVLVVLMAGAFYFTAHPLREMGARAVEDEVSRAQRMHSELGRLEALDFRNLVSTLSRRAGVAAVFDRPDEKARRDAAFDECEAINGKLSAQRKADIVAIVDAQGKVVARDLNWSAMFGEDVRKQFPPVDAALRGDAEHQHGIVSLSPGAAQMTQMAAAPIARADGKIQGALLVGYVVTARDAQAKRDQLGADVGYFFQRQVQTSSFTEGGAPGAKEDGKEDGNRTHALNAALFQLGDKPGAQALDRGAATGSFHITLDGHDYVAIAAPLYASDKSAGFVVLKALAQTEEIAHEVGGKVIGFGILAILVALGAAVMTAQRFIKPLDRIELGVAEIINGNIDYQFRPVGPDFEGLSNSLNVMLSRLLGREEPGDDEVEEEEEAAGAKWQSDQMVIEELPASALTGQPSGDPAVVALGEQNEGAYYPRLYAEYIAALKAAGLPTRGLSVQLFTAKLRLLEGGLKEKWSCKQVRFTVSGSGSDVRLKPVPLY